MELVSLLVVTDSADRSRCVGEETLTEMEGGGERSYRYE